ncbi:MAG: sulfite exporter TauE/SafE family protein [Acidiferrobacterales bacterium]|nr:sulfite exporter TauE/SafE family protein [Acidiferrobacterales bacterium]
MFESTALLLGSTGIFSFFVGVLIGICGVGGILIIPFLVYVAGIDIHTVIPACMAGFAFAAIFAVYAYARRGSIRWDKAIYLIAGAAPGSYLGAITLQVISSVVLEIIVAALVIVSGIRALGRDASKSAGSGIEKTAGSVLVLVGFLVGYGSSISGTGGPLLLVPTLLLLDFPVLAAVGLSMAIQIPISPFATLGHVIHGSVNWPLAIPIGIGVSAGITLGAVIAHRITPLTMERTVATVMLISGGLIVIKLLA